MTTRKNFLKRTSSKTCPMSCPSSKLHGSLSAIYEGGRWMLQRVITLVLIQRSSWMSSAPRFTKTCGGGLGPEGCEKFQLSLKVLLRKDKPGRSEGCTNSVLHQMQETVLKAHEIDRVLARAFAPASRYSWEVKGWPSIAFMARHCSLQTTTRRVLYTYSCCSCL